jgi:hypothetical protein
VGAEMNDELWRKDIEQLAYELPKAHKNFFYAANEAEFFARIEDLQRDVGNMDTYDIVLELARIVATARDAHTAVMLPHFNRLPFDCYPFFEGLYITATDETNKELLNAKILQIGGSGTKTIYDAITAITPHENLQFVLSSLPRTITCVDILSGLGIVDSLDSVDMTVMDSKGRTFSKNIRPVKYDDYQVVKSDIPNLPLYRQRDDQFYWSSLNDGVFYIYYGRCRDMEASSVSVSDFCEDLIWALSDNAGIEKVVIDLRHNIGGNSELFKPFLQWLSGNASLNQRGKLFVIVGRDTFSSALLNLFYLKFMTQAIFLGEPTGGKPNHYGEVKYLELQHSGLYIRYSTKYYDLVEDDEQLFFVPDIECRVSFEDYMNLVDRCMLEVVSCRSDDALEKQ